MTSTLSKYKSRIKYTLLDKYDWEPEQIDKWFKEHPDYLQAMFESAAPASTTAYYINEI